MWEARSGPAWYPFSEPDPVRFSRMLAAERDTESTALVFGWTKAARMSYRAGVWNHALCASTRDCATSDTWRPPGSRTSTRTPAGNDTSARAWLPTLGYT